MRAETRIVEQKERAIAMERHGEHPSMVMNAYTTTQELLGHCQAMQGFYAVCAKVIQQVNHELVQCE
jgi:hypothetical protein